MLWGLSLLNNERWFKSVCKVVVFIADSVASNLQNRQSGREDGYKIQGVRTNLNPQVRAGPLILMVFMLKRTWHPSFRC